MRAFAFVLVLLCAASAHAQRPQYSVQFRALEFETGSNTKMAAYGLATGAAYSPFSSILPERGQIRARPPLMNARTPREIALIDEPTSSW